MVEEDVDRLLGQAAGKFIAFGLVECKILMSLVTRVQLLFN